MPTCGDGYKWLGHEECDDANAVAGDGCHECQAATRAFVTSTTYDGNLGGLEGAAAKCQARATAAGLGGTWDVWLSTDTSAPLTRFVPNAAGYARRDGSLIANDFADLIDGSLDNLLSQTETGVSVGNSDVWTGTDPFGVATTATCNNWTSNSSLVSGEYGRSSTSTSTWSDNGTPAACNGLRRLFCFEQ
ncbi:DUF1554 domain-containing protein [Nannocystis pusilla]|uniref:DUF1554 domain-containing protein n=1 Tax=Nannocystis pusilla TaxID=889268 RepID=A0A9X3IVC2_9BACT|nr:DUF1554 domain-containing protein [Nannocystis pusilla]